jgi:MFS family permease
MGKRQFELTLKPKYEKSRSIWALAPALLSIKYPQKKGKMMGTYNAAIHLGLTIGPVLGIVLHKIWNGNQAFLLFAALCFAGAIVVYATVEKVHPNLEKEETSIKLRDLFSILRKKMVLLTLCGITMYGAGYGSFITVIPAFLISSKSFTPAYIGIFFSMFYVAISLSQLMFGSLSDKFGRMLFMVIGLFLAGVGITAFPFLESIWIIIVLTVASLGLGIFHISSMAFLNELVPDTLKGTISGAYYLFWGVGYFLGPLILSRNTVDSEPYRGFCYFSLLFISGAMAMSILYRKNHLS